MHKRVEQTHGVDLFYRLICQFMKRWGHRNANTESGIYRMNDVYHYKTNFRDVD